ncbi:MAG TPA: PDZ domain-containing protein [Candidatus Acidoferrales bacterium]|nr:PDZ domain-containing protein [Candidatus Acidoferrales bacterium]
MRINWGFSLACLAAVSVAATATFGQPSTAPRARAAAGTYVVQHGGSYMGIGVVDITTDRARALNLKEERGVEVTSIVDDGPAAKAGIKEGDVVLDYNGQAVQGIEQFQRLVRETPPGRQVKVGVWRSGAAQTITATVGERKGTVITSDDGGWNFTVPAMPPMPPMPNINIDIPRFSMAYQSQMLGIEGESLESQEQLADFFGVKEGVLVKAVKRNSAAEKAGLKAGDVIVKVDDSKVGSSSEITRTLRGLRSKKTFTLTVVRNKKEMPLTVTMEDRGSIRVGVEVVATLRVATQTVAAT